MTMAKWKTACVPFLVIAIVLSFFARAGADFAGDLVVREAGKIVKELLGAELTVGSITGNPIKGFTARNVTMTAEEGPFLSAGFLDLKINARSLLAMKPRVDSISISSADIDGEILARRIAAMDVSSGDSEMTIQDARLVNSTVRSRWGAADISAVSLTISGSVLSADVDLSFNSVPVRGNTAVRLEGESADVTHLEFLVGTGEISASGRVAPSLSAAGIFRNLNVKELLAFWPTAPAGVSDGKVSLGFTGDGKWNAPFLAGNFEYSGSSLAGIPVESVKGDWQFESGVLAVTGIQATTSGTPISGKMSMTFIPGLAPVLDAAISSPFIPVGKSFKIQDASVHLRKDGPTVDIVSASARSGKSSVSASGKVLLPQSPGKDTDLDIAVRVSSADIGELSGAAGMKMPVDGILDGTASVKGPFSGPSIAVTAASSRISLRGAAVHNFVFSLSGNPWEMLSADVSATLCGGPLSGKGSIKTGQTPDATFELSGTGIDIAELASALPRAERLRPGGKASLFFKGAFSDGNAAGEGALFSPALSVLGLQASDFSYPLFLEGNTLSGKDASVTLYGGRMTGSGSIDLETFAFSHTVSFEGIDLNGFLRDFAGIPSGKATGRAHGSGDFSGSFSPGFSFAGTVRANAPALGLAGFSATDGAIQVKMDEKKASVSSKAVIDGSKTFLQGTISSYMTEPKLDLTANIFSVNAARAAGLVPAARNFGLSGALNTDLAIKGKPSSPQISGKVWSEKITAGKETLTSPSVSFVLGERQTSISSASAKWRGARLSASGTIGGSGTLNITAKADSLQPSALYGFIPALASYKSRGTASAEAVITGSAAAPRISLSLSSPNLQLPGLADLKNLKVSGTLSGRSENLGNSDFDLHISAPAASFGGIPLSSLSVKLKKTGRNVNILSASAKSGKASITGSGGTVLGAKASDPATLNLTFSLSDGDLASLASAGGFRGKASGTVNGTAAVKGPASNPSITARFSSPKASFSGIDASEITLALSGTPNSMKIDQLSTRFAGGTITGTGTAKMAKASDITINLSGKSLDLASLASGMSGAKGLSMAGKLNGTFNLRIAGNTTRGSGKIASPTLQVSGMKASNLSYPLSLSGNTLTAKGASFSFCGGTVKGNGTLNTQTLKYSHSLSFSGIDVNGAVQAFSGGLGGKVTGKASGSASVSGAFTPKFSIAGKGKVSVGSGSLSGFTALDILAKLHGTSNVRYASASIPFRLETNRVILEKGSRADAPKNDPMYRYLTAEGPVGPRGALNLKCAGNMNVKVLNALSGGAAGGLTGGSLEDILKGILGGAQKGMAVSEFRDVSFTLGGNTDKPSISNLKTAAPAPAQAPAVQQQSSPSPQPSPSPAPSPAPTPAPKPLPKPKTPEEILKEKLLESIFKK